MSINACPQKMIITQNTESGLRTADCVLGHQAFVVVRYKLRNDSVVQTVHMLAFTRAAPNKSAPKT